MSKKYRSILQFTYDIEECIDIIQEEIENKSYEDFIEDKKTIRYIETIRKNRGSNNSNTKK